MSDLEQLARQIKTLTLARDELLAKLETVNRQLKHKHAQFTEASKADWISRNKHRMYDDPRKIDQQAADSCLRELERELARYARR